ncbi:hypothetical protein LOK49_LG10G02515 [Camellia lanceoleosa]|uniref:Uncharacterized protein n=1 Tax=Camellia lanceoleosa TaxID=1840588 RepID=A0ACC0G827_9ERIC|nr:hypothetical protein LOK49_LG10G02515 [Camellia lanceoleosa]
MSSSFLRLNHPRHVPPSHGIVGHGLGLCPNAFYDGVSLREWLKVGHCKARIAETFTVKEKSLSENYRNEKGPLELAIHRAVSQLLKKQNFGGIQENLNFIRQWPQFPLRLWFKTSTAKGTDVNLAGPQDSWNELNNKHNLKREYKSASHFGNPRVSNTYQMLSTHEMIHWKRSDMLVLRSLVGEVAHFHQISMFWVFFSLRISGCGYSTFCACRGSATTSNNHLNKIC